tara:strand:- start:3041 stop:3238 length:198 start_codon:yes stop_codon:yes gene_type:complete
MDKKEEKSKVPFIFRTHDLEVHYDRMIYAEAFGSDLEHWRTASDFADAVIRYMKDPLKNRRYENE